MDFYSLAPVAAVLDTAYSGVLALAHLLEPMVGDGAVALSILLVTALVRLCLLPVGASVLRAEATRARLAPRLAELRRRHRAAPDRLQRETMALYSAEGVSPFARCLPMLAQAPVLSIVYGVFALPVIAGHRNALLGAHLMGVDLGRSLFSVVAAGVWPDPLVFIGLLAAIAVAAWVSRASARRAAAGAAQPSEAAGGAVAAMLTWAPFLTVAFAAVVPLATTLYLATTTTWSAIERIALRRMLRLDVGGRV